MPSPSGRQEGGNIPTVGQTRNVLVMFSAILLSVITSSGTLLWSSSPGSGSPMGSIGAFEHLHTTLPYLVPLHLQPHSALIQGGAWPSSVFLVPGTGTGMELVLSVFPCVPCPLGWSQDSSLTIRPDSGFRNLAPCLWLGRFRWKTNRESWWGCL